MHVSAVRTCNGLNEREVEGCVSFLNYKTATLCREWNPVPTAVENAYQ